MKNYNRKQKSPFEWEPKDWIPIYGYVRYQRRTRDFRTATEEDMSNKKDSNLYHIPMIVLAATGLLKIIL